MATNNEDENRSVQENTLEHVLVALQKSLSRVNAISSNVPAHQARALILGDLGFEINLKCDQDGDKLTVTNSGGISINLKGIINTDMEITREEDE